MAGDDPIELLIAMWASVVAALGPAGAAELRARYRTSDDPLRRRLALIAFLVERLPVEHPVRRAAVDDSTVLGGVAAPPSWHESLAHVDGLLAEIERSAQITPEELGRRVRERLLRTPAYSPDDLAGGPNPSPPHGVIRLVAPDGTVRYPVFQFDQDGTPLPVVLEVNRILRADRDPWGVADWWLSANSWLSEPPAHLLGRGRDDDLVALARAVREAV